MQVELLKLDKNDEIDTLEQCIAAAWEIHGEPHVPRQVVQNFYGLGRWGWSGSEWECDGSVGAYGFGCYALCVICDLTFSGERAI